METIPVVNITPATWDPSTDIFSRNESLMMDSQGGMVLPRDQPLNIIIDTSRAIISALWVNPCEIRHIDEIAFQRDLLALQPHHVIDNSCSPYSISNTLDISSFAAELDHQLAVSSFGIDVGAVVAHTDEYLLPEVSNWYFPTEQAFNNGDYNVAALNAYAHRGVKPEHLAKVWKIPLEAARRTVDVTSQRYVRPQGNQLTRNYSTGDRALRYRRVRELFFTDTFFAGKKLRSSRGNICAQLFVTNKGFLYVVPMMTEFCRE